MSKTFFNSVNDVDKDPTGGLVFFRTIVSTFLQFLYRDEDYNMSHTEGYSFRSSFDKKPYHPILRLIYGIWYIFIDICLTGIFMFINVAALFIFCTIDFIFWIVRSITTVINYFKLQKMKKKCRYYTLKDVQQAQKKSKIWAPEVECKESCLSPKQSVKKINW